LSWLAAHAPEQVVLLLGNHDVARVGELAHFADDAAFEAARARADLAYQSGKVDAEAQAKFLVDYPFVANAESVARDFSCFSSEQRRLVELLLRTRRFRLAHAHGGLLAVHAGVTSDDLAAVSVSGDDAAQVADGLNAWLDARVAAWVDGPLDLKPFHQAGSAKGGEGRGALFHRPADPTYASAADLEGPPRRRFDPRRLPAGFAQVIGHIRDGKCRETMPAWCEKVAAGDGPLRSLRITGDQVEYVNSCRDDARLYFIDAGMLHTSPERYQLFDLDRRRPLAVAR
jgi:hypothetical protein